MRNNSIMEWFNFLDKIAISKNRLQKNFKEKISSIERNLIISTQILS